MNKRNNLFDDLNIKRQKENFCCPPYIDIQNIKTRVNGEIAFASAERKSNIMKSKKKVSIIAIAAILILGVTVFAAGGLVKMWFGSSSAIPDYKSLPTEQRVKDDIGYETVLINEFKNGYTFKDGNIVNNKLADENGKLIEKFKSVSFRYEKDGDMLYFSQDKFNSEKNPSGEPILAADGIEIYYFAYKNKLVPPTYKLTEEDKKAEKNGELVFSYGSEKVKISKVQSVTWEKDGVFYELMQIDGKLSADELADTAKEIIKS